MLSCSAVFIWPSLDIVSPFFTVTLDDCDNYPRGKTARGRRNSTVCTTVSCNGESKTDYLKYGTFDSIHYAQKNG